MKEDPEVTKAKEVLKDTDTYHAILAGTWAKKDHSE